MSKNYMQEIKNRILSSEDGSVFSTSDFADIADTNTVRSALYRLVKDNILRRIINGIYEKPKYSKLLDEYVAADPAAVAQALARSYHWTILIFFRGWVLKDILISTNQGIITCLF